MAETSGTQVGVLFADRERDDPLPAGPTESTWDFLSRTSDAAFTRVRDTMNDWFTRYPSAEQPDLRGRMASGDQQEFHAAWFELYLYELHRRLGFAVDVHPDLPDAGTHPDFAVARSNEQFYLEANVFGDRNGAGRAARRNAIVASIERIQSPDFWFWFDIEAEGPDSPPMKHVRRRVEQWVRTLDWADERQNMHPDLAPCRVEEVAGWRFSFKAIARPPERRGQTRPTICGGPSDGGVFDHPVTLQARLEGKAGKYGAPDRPVVIAIRLDRLAVDGEDVHRALVGDGCTGRPGLFFDCDGTPRRAYVAGVLTWSLELRPWSITREAPTFWRNGAATHPTPELPWRCVTVGHDDVGVTPGTFVPATTFADVAGATDFIHPGAWPGEPFPGE
ncbi:MAG TPA: hypothetical protein VN238_05605 [Solirubrobacteraceae bacterium]|nr:hypothetical protein [Solirubrobacteraceae bacterium]